MKILTTSKYWDCDCAINYIHRRGMISTCDKCGAHRDDSPDSRADEVLEIGGEIDEGYPIMSFHRMNQYGSEVMQEYWFWNRGDEEVRILTFRDLHDDAQEVDWSTIALGEALLRFVLRDTSPERDWYYIYGQNWHHGFLLQFYGMTEVSLIRKNINLPI